MSLPDSIPVCFYTAALETEVTDWPVFVIKDGVDVHKGTLFPTINVTLSAHCTITRPDTTTFDTELGYSDGITFTSVNPLSFGLYRSPPARNFAGFLGGIPLADYYPDLSEFDPNYVNDAEVLESRFGGNGDGSLQFACQQKDQVFYAHGALSFNFLLAPVDGSLGGNQIYVDCSLQSGFVNPNPSMTVLASGTLTCWGKPLYYFISASTGISGDSVTGTASLTVDSP